MSKNISADSIISAARRIADRYGLASISIRGVARESGISVGSLYNYFSSCDELVIATIDDIFESMFYEDFCHPTPGEDYLAYCERLFDSLKTRLASPESNMIEQLQELAPSVRASGIGRMSAMLEHVAKGLESVLAGDERVDKSLLTGPLSSSDIARQTVSCMMSSLRSGDDCATYFAMLSRVLYKG